MTQANVVPSATTAKAQAIIREILKTTTTPILVISGDHHLVFPMGKWKIGMR
jgi:hypothetical protein